MRRPWIKIDTSTPDKPEICTIATSLRIQSDAVVGKLVRLWSWAELNRVSSNDLGVTTEFIDKLVGQKRFGAAMIEAGWLAQTNDKLSFARFERHNGPLAKSRVLTAKRVKRHRTRKEESNDQQVSKLPPSNASKVKVSSKSGKVSEDVNHIITAVVPLNINKNSLIHSSEIHKFSDQATVLPPTVTQESSLPPKVFDEPSESNANDQQLVTEMTPKKRKPKANDSANQPMLF